MINLQTLAIALCVFSFVGVAMYAVDILIPGTDSLIQQADAIRRSTHSCTYLPFRCL
jgi:hypothetical protein